MRTETGIARYAVSVAFAAVQLGRKIFGDLEGRRALLLGAGKMSHLVAKHLASNGVHEIIVASRRYGHAVETAERTGGRAVHWEGGLSMLSEVDIVVSRTNATRPVLTREQVARARKRRRGEPLFLIDIAVPRDIEPQANEIDGVYLYDIDGLQGVIDANLEERRRAATEAEDLVRREARAFDRWRQSQTVAPLIVALREGLLEVGRREVERHVRRHGPFGPEQRGAAEELARSIIQKVLHRPVRHLRGAVERGDLDQCVRLYERLFDWSPVPGADGKDIEEDEVQEDGPARGPTRVLRGGKADE